MTFYVPYAGYPRFVKMLDQVARYEACYVRSARVVNVAGVSETFDVYKYPAEEAKR